MLKKLQYLYDICFGDSAEFSRFVFKHKFSLKNSYYTLDGEQPVSALFTVPKKLVCGDKILESPYICGVCTHPDHRRRGLADKLMERAHSDLKKRGHYMCALHPFNHGFYQKMGYNTYTRVNEYKIAGAKESGVYSFEPAQAADAPVMLKLYNQFMSAYNGYVYRDLKQMRYTINEFLAAGRADIILLSGKPIGYAAYDGDGFMSELCCQDIGALLTNPMYNNLTVNLPADSPLGKAVDFTMIKLLDRPKFLRAAGFSDISRFKDIDDGSLISFVMGSFEEFSLSPPRELAGIFPKRSNYVFDKY